MESQQIVELLLAMRQEMNANADAKIRTEAENKACQERMEANREADRTRQEQILKAIHYHVTISII
jgi:hypothetical protein